MQSRLAKPSASLLRGAVTTTAMASRSASVGARTPVKAVIFDMGGVLTEQPATIWSVFERSVGLPHYSLVRTMLAEAEKFDALENGKIIPREFAEIILPNLQKQTSQPISLERLTHAFGDPPAEEDAPHGHRRPEMLAAVQAIRDRGFKCGLLTNNWWRDEKRDKTLLLIDTSIFDVVVESCRVGMRKPTKAIYELMLAKLNCQPQEAVFLDDLGHNLKPAAELGIHTIKVGDPQKALDELQAYVGIPLPAWQSTHTTAPRPGMHLPHEHLQSYLRSILDDPHSSLSNIRQFAHGQSNPTYLLQFGNRDLVLRKKPPGKLLRSAHQVEREFRVMTAVSRQGVPVPEMLHLCEDSSVIGTPFYIMTFVPGVLFKAPALPTLTVPQRRKVYSELNATLRKVHAVDLHKAGLTNYGKSRDYLKRNIQLWTHQYNKSQTHDIPTFTKLANWLIENIPKDEQLTLIHGDYR